jgi:Flp pilus assembly pilin Flp
LFEGYGDVWGVVGKAGHPGRGRAVGFVLRAFASLHSDERGQGATEYAVIVVLVIAGIAAITLALTGALNTAYDAVSDAITNAV